MPSHATYFLDEGLCHRCTRDERDNAALDAREATIRADERAKIEAWVRLRADDLIGTGRVAEINTLTMCADAIRDGVDITTKGCVK